MTGNFRLNHFAKVKSIGILLIKKDFVENPFKPISKSCVQKHNRKITMADLNQFQRSKDRINEILHYLMHKTGDPETAFYIQSLETALKTIELKMEEYQQGLNANKNAGMFDLSF